MRYIHSLNTTLRWRKYRSKILAVSTVVMAIGIITVNFGNIKKTYTISKINNNIKQIESKNKTINEKIDILKIELEDDEEFITFKDNKNKINAEKIPNLYNVDKIYEYMHNVPGTIILGKIDIRNDVSYIKGQSTSYKQLELYREELKRSGLFSLIELKEVEYIKTGDYVQFELRCLTKNIDTNKREELEKEEKKER